MSEEIIIAGLLVILLASLLFTKWSPAGVFGGVMLSCYFLGLVDTNDILQKIANPGVVTLSLLLMMSQGLELGKGPVRQADFKKLLCQSVADVWFYRSDVSVCQ